MLWALLLASGLSPKSLFLIVVLFIISLDVVLFIKWLLITLMYFCLKGAVSSRAYLQMARKESNTLWSCKFLFLLVISDLKLSLEKFL